MTKSPEDFEYISIGLKEKWLCRTVKLYSGEPLEIIGAMCEFHFKYKDSDDQTRFERMAELIDRLSPSPSKRSGVVKTILYRMNIIFRENRIVESIYSNYLLSPEDIFREVLPSSTDELPFLFNNPALPLWVEAEDEYVVKFLKHYIGYCGAYLSSVLEHFATVCIKSETTRTPPSPDSIRVFQDLWSIMGCNKWPFPSSLEKDPRPVVIKRLSAWVESMDPLSEDAVEYECGNYAALIFTALRGARVQSYQMASMSKYVSDGLINRLGAIQATFAIDQFLMDHLIYDRPIRTGEFGSFTKSVFR